MICTQYKIVFYSELSKKNDSYTVRTVIIWSVYGPFSLKAEELPGFYPVVYLPLTKLVRVSLLKEVY